MNIFVAKLDFNTQDAELRQAFERFGEVTSAKIITDKFTGRSKGFGFVEMPDDESANSAIRELNDSQLDGRTIVVKKAIPKEEGGGGGSRPNRGGGHGGHGGGGQGGGNRGGGSRDSGNRGGGGYNRS